MAPGLSLAWLLDVIPGLTRDPRRGGSSAEWIAGQARNDIHGALRLSRNDIHGDPRCRSDLPARLQPAQRLRGEVQVGREFLLRQALFEFRVLAQEALHAA